MFDRASFCVTTAAEGFFDMTAVGSPYRMRIDSGGSRKWRHREDRMRFISAQDWLCPEWTHSRARCTTHTVHHTNMKRL